MFALKAISILHGFRFVLVVSSAKKHGKRPFLPRKCLASQIAHEYYRYELFFGGLGNVSYDSNNSQHCTGQIQATLGSVLLAYSSRRTVE
jgi:hypothetical protein